MEASEQSTLESFALAALPSEADFWLQGENTV